MTKTYWKSLDENMNSKSKLDFESSSNEVDSSTPKPFPELGTIVEVSDSSEFYKDTTTSKSESCYAMAHPADELLDKDVDVHEEEIDGTMDNDFGTNESSVIKVESSDESQTTIEIAAASPVDLSHELEVARQKEALDGEQVYNEDAVPMHFEYEMEVGDSGVDPLDVPTPATSEAGTDKTTSSGDNKAVGGVLVQEQIGGFLTLFLKINILANLGDIRQSVTFLWPNENSLYG